MIQNAHQIPQILKNIKHDINCLIDDDRNTRRNALMRIKNQLQTISSEQIIQLFSANTNLTKYLLRVLADKIQTNRQLTLAIIESYVTKVPLHTSSKQYLEPIVIALITRINATPFNQTSEQLRLTIIQLLQKMVIHKDCFYGNIKELSNGLSKCLLDPYPELKKKTSELIMELSGQFKSTIGYHSFHMIKSLAENLKHQHSKVRKITLKTLSQLIVTESAATHFGIVEVPLKATLSDKIADVRLAALECSANLLNLLGPKYLGLYEATLVGYLLTGLVDDNQGNVEKTKLLLEECGNNLYQLEQEKQQTMQIQPNTCKS